MPMMMLFILIFWLKYLIDCYLENKSAYVVSGRLREMKKTFWAVIKVTLVFH